MVFMNPGAFLVAFGAVVLAEMGDKTQLVIMAFAAKYRLIKVFFGLFIATVITHTLAVVAGNFITRIEALGGIIQCAASLSFIVFALWTLRKEGDEEDKVSETKFGAVVTVAAAFLIAEMGDKTQLASIALSAKFPSFPVSVLIGAVAGMLVADGLGIILGIVLRKKIPEKKIKFVSAAAFLLFGLIGTYDVLRREFALALPVVICLLVLLAAVTALVARILLKRK